MVPATPDAVSVRGPGNGGDGYCLVGGPWTDGSSTLDSASSTAVPVEVAINPTGSPFTTASGLVVPLLRFAAQWTPIGGTQQTETGDLPDLNEREVLGPRDSLQLLQLLGDPLPDDLRLGGVHRILDRHSRDRNVVVYTGTSNPMPTLGLSASDNKGGEFGRGTSVGYTFTPSVSGADESGTITFTDPFPTGLTPTSTAGTDASWTCGIVSSTVTCTHAAVTTSGPHAEHRYSCNGRIQREHGVRCAQRPWIRLCKRCARCRCSRPGHRLRDPDGDLTFTQHGSHGRRDAGRGHRDQLQQRGIGERRVCNGERHLQRRAAVQRLLQREQPDFDHALHPDRHVGRRRRSPDSDRDQRCVGAGSGSTYTYTKAASTTTVSSSQNPSVSGQAVSFTANLTSGATGNVVFTITPSHGSAVTCSGGNTVPVAASAATCSIPPDTLIAAGSTYAVSANYGGDGNSSPRRET